MSRPLLWRALNPTLRQLHARTGDRQRGHCLPWFDSRDAIADRIHYTNQIPTWSEGHSGRLGMNALAHHQVGQGNTCGQHSHSDFATLWLAMPVFDTTLLTLIGISSGIYLGFKVSK
jgi:hypothetical protein